MSSSQTAPTKHRRNINFEASARGGQAPRRSHRVADNFIEYLGTSSSVPVTPISLEAILAKLTDAQANDEHYAVVSKVSSHRKARCGSSVYSTTLLEYDPTPNGAEPQVYRAVHVTPQRWTFRRIAAVSNGHLIALLPSDPFEPVRRSTH